MRIALALASLSLFAAAGCGEDESGDAAPAACLSGSDAYLAALEDAPGEVALEGGTPLGECLTEGQGGGQLATIGQAAVEAATELNARALENPAGDATVQLGYLVGSFQEAASKTGGIHEDLILRLDSAARFTPKGESLGAGFERAFGEGYAAAQAGA